jgi:arsenite-transporting ATPase
VATTTIHLFGGKGGTGKTTSAAAYAVTLAAAGARVLVLSTDPAPSLGDVLNARLTSQPRRVPAVRAPLYAAELDAPLAMRRWLRSRRATLETIALRGTWLDESDVAALLSLSLPGIDEIAALLEIVRFGQSGLYDAIVIDAAPTGHALRMLALPATMAGVARVLDLMQEKHRVMVEALRGAWRPDDADMLIRQMENDARGLAELLRAEGRCRVWWVTLAEDLSVEETFDSVDWLAREGIAVRRIIVNRVTPAPPQPCRWCQASRRQQLAAVSRFGARFRIISVDARVREPIGVRSLAALGRELEREVPVESRPARRPIARVTADLFRERGARAALVSDPRTRLVIFGGKGGVGKTTCAAATALELARQDPRRQVLLLSVDPAHSLGDVLALGDQTSAGTVANGPENLRVRHLDSSGALASLRQRSSAAIDAMFARATGTSAINLSHDRQVLHGLLDLAPPGLDELAAIIDVIRVLDSETPVQVTVMDTAPTGHAVRLLEMPELVQAWVKALMMILLKYQPVTGMGDLGSALLEISQGITRLRTLLTDRQRTSFIVVTRPAGVPLAETRRLLRTLAKLRVHVPALVVNAAGAGECSRCRRVAAQQRVDARSTGHAAHSAGVATMIVAPAVVPPPTGVRALSAWRTAWRHVALSRSHVRVP